MPHRSSWSSAGDRLARFSQIPARALSHGAPFALAVSPCEGLYLGSIMSVRFAREEKGYGHYVILIGQMPSRSG